jgi:pimeloyl-ACP methyl ester carboxylesterase
MEVPFFVPTSFGDLAVTGAVDPAATDGGGPVLFLAGGEMPRSRNRVRVAMTRDLARTGRPAFRVDYPGAGLSPAPRLKEEEETAALLEVVRWLCDVCGSDTIALGGTCGGALKALRLAAMEPSVDAVVAIDSPIIKRRKSSRRVRGGLAAIDPLGGRVTSLLTGGSAGKELEYPWFPGLIEDLEVVGPRAKVAFVYGADDAFYPDLQRLLSESPLSSDVKGRLTVEILPGAQLYGFSDPADMKWLRETVVSFLTAAEVSHA